LVRATKTRDSFSVALAVLWIEGMHYGKKLL